MAAGPRHFETIIIGAGAAGLFAAGFAAKAGPTLVLDHRAEPAEKIRISGGGRCNFTNLGTTPAHFVSANPHFAKSALARFTPQHFLELVRRAGIAWHEKAAGQLFCDGSATQITAMLIGRMRAEGAELALSARVGQVRHADGRFHLATEGAGGLSAANLVIATGGKSIPKIGASDFGYRLARQFGLNLTETRAALVPLTFDPRLLAETAPLAGLSVPAEVTAGAMTFAEPLLFTHRGLSGPGILQASLYWREGRPLRLNLMLEDGALDRLRTTSGGRDIGNALGTLLPQRLALLLARRSGLSGRLADLTGAELRHLAAVLTDWTVTPTGSEGYRTAEVTLGGVATGGLNSATMEARHLPGLFVIGEVVDVTGQLGGYNFQWAWASAAAAGRAIAQRRR